MKKENKILEENYPEAIRKALQKLDIVTLNPMQREVLSSDVQRDLLLLSPTGSGKTLAFCCRYCLY